MNRSSNALRALSVRGVVVSRSTVVRGAKSDLLTAETAEKMQAAAPAMKLAVVAGVGHAPELNELEAVQAIDAFLSEVERTGSA